MNLRSFFASQGKIIANYNLLVEGLLFLDANIDLEKLDEEGTCSGLSAYYMFYAHQGEKSTFFTFLEFLMSLTPNKITEIIGGYKKNELHWIATEDNELIEINDLIRFLKNISLAQTSQLHKIIGANWERNYTFICSQNELEKKLMLSGLDEGQFISVVIGTHEFVIERTSNGFYLFEPNVITFPQPLLDSVTDVSKAILINLHKTGFLKNNDDKVGCSLHFLSFNHPNYKLEKALLMYEKSSGIDAMAKKIINEYFAGMVSLTDLVLVLLPILPDSTEDKLPENLREHLTEFIHKIKHFDHNIDISNLKKDEIAYRDVFITSLLYLAAQSNQLTLCSKLINAKFDLEIQNDDGETPLFPAISNGFGLMVEMLVKAGANILHTNKNDETPISDAVDFGNAAILDFLLKAVMNFDPTIFLPLAIEEGKLDLVKVLLINNADSNYLNKDGQTILHIAAQNGDINLMEVICKFGKNLKVNMVDAFGFTPLVFAVDKGNLTNIKMLVEIGADFMQQDPGGFSAFSIALLRGKTDIVNYFLSINKPNTEMLKMVECDRIFTQAMQTLIVGKKPFFSQNDYPALFAKAKNEHPFYFEARLGRQIFLQRGAQRTMTNDQIKRLCLSNEILYSNNELLVKAAIDLIKENAIPLTAPNEIHLFKSLESKLNKPKEKNIYLDRFR